MNLYKNIKNYSPDAEGLGGALAEENISLLGQSFSAMQNLKQVYFIGIGGIGMSAIARFLQSKGVAVSGYDKTSTVLTRELEASGISIHYEDNVDWIPKEVDVVIYTPAIPKEHLALNYYRNNGYNVVKRSDALQVITENSFNICIAGTHGKTTITSMVAHLLRDSGFGCNAFLGGIAANYGTNFWSNDKNLCVVEADEYDRSFLKLLPDVAVITSMDADHLDIYGTAEDMQQAFVDFAKKVKPGGFVLGKLGLEKTTELSELNFYTYSLQNNNADVYGKNIVIKEGGYEYDVVVKGKLIEGIRLNMGGMHNVENSIAAIAIASSLGIENNKIKAAVENYKGVKRRFEYVVKKEGLTFIDDYAHHPEELRALIHGAKTLFSDRKCTVIFQPHLYSRTKDHAAGFAEVLSLADEIVLLPIYPARELPIEGVSSEMILEKISKEKKRVMNKEEVLAWVENEYSKTLDKDLREVIITAGAGDIDTLVEPIKNILSKNK